MIRLHKEAPWDEVTLSNGVINKINWSEETLDYKPIKKWVVFKPVEIVEQVDYSSLSKSELTTLAKSKNIDTSGLSKAQLIEKLCTL